MHTHTHTHTQAPPPPSPLPPLHTSTHTHTPKPTRIHTLIVFVLLAMEEAGGTLGLHLICSTLHLGSLHLVCEQSAWRNNFASTMRGRTFLQAQCVEEEIRRLVQGDFWMEDGYALGLYLVCRGF